MEDVAMKLISYNERQFIASRQQPCKLSKRYPEGGEFIGRGQEIQCDR